MLPKDGFLGNSLYSLICSCKVLVSCIIFLGNDKIKVKIIDLEELFRNFNYSLLPHQAKGTQNKTYSKMDRGPLFTIYTYNLLR